MGESETNNQSKQVYNFLVQQLNTKSSRFLKL